MSDPSPYLLVTYSLTDLSQTQKVKFYYALKGRGTTKGFLEKTGALSLARSVFLIQAGELALTEAFVKAWKCHYHIRQVYLSPHQLGQMHQLTM